MTKIRTGDGSRRVALMPRATRTDISRWGAVLPLLPIGAYFWLIHQYAVDVVYEDQWADIVLLGRWYDQSLTFSTLWASHGDHRILFPNLIVIALALFTHLNVVFEEYVSAAMLVAAAALFILAHRRRAPSVPLICYTPVTLVLFSFVQYQNTLWGFQMAWYLVTLALAVTLLLLDGPSLTNWALAGAVGAAVVGSFSSLQGLLIWPAGLLLLYGRHRSSRILVIWIVCALTATFAYFYHLNPANEGLGKGFTFTHPLYALKFFLFVIGGVLGVQYSSSPWPILLFGAVVTVLAVALVVTYTRHRDETSSLVGVALVCFGVLFAATVTEGRASYGLASYGLLAIPSRYASCGLLILVGSYLVALERVPIRGLLAVRAVQADRPERQGVMGDTIMWIVLAVVIGIQVIFGTGHGLASAKEWSQGQKNVADIIANLHEASDSLIVSNPGFIPNAQDTRQLVQVLKANHLSLYSTDGADYYSKVGLFPGLIAIHVRVVVPKGGATLTGTRVLDALASDRNGISNLSFRLSGPALHNAQIIPGRSTSYGWVAFLDTTRYPNGAYELSCIVHGFGNNVTRSPSIMISVRNHP